jgi:hypothetical protein
VYTLTEHTPQNIKLNTTIVKNLAKTCFFEKISIIKLSAKTHLSLNFKHMGGTNKALAVATISTLMATTTPANAETTKNLNQEQIICETKEICQKLSQTIQAQINNRKSKDNLTRNIIIKR